MNWFRVIVIVILGSLSISVVGQNSMPFAKDSYIIPYNLLITDNKTTNLVFPTSISSIDRGSQDIMVEKAEGVENILRIKAGEKMFAETNLSVITTDGKLYSFLVAYTDKPSYLNVHVEHNFKKEISLSKNDRPDIQEPGEFNEHDLRFYSSLAALLKSNIGSVNNASNKMNLQLAGLYIKENTLFYRLNIENHSNIIYDIHQLRFYIRDKKQPKRTATQEIEIKPIFILGNANMVAGNGSKSLVIAVPKFTIPDGKYMEIEIMEQNGGRHLTLKVKNRHVFRAISL